MAARPRAAASSSEEAVVAEAEAFLGRLRRSLQEQTFVRLTLTNGNSKRKEQQQQQQQQKPLPKQPQPPVDKLLARLIEGSGGGGAARVQIVYTHPTSATTKTLPMEEAPAAIAQAFTAALNSARFKAARLFTTEADWVLERGKQTGGKAGLRQHRNKPTFTTVEIGQHDRVKKRRLAMPGLEEGDEDHENGDGVVSGKRSGFMDAYGILDKRGQPKKGMRDKHRQIERFVEILEAQLKQWDSGRVGEGAGGRRGRLRLLDAGCGRGLLTFAAFEFLTSLGYTVEARGVDMRPDVVAKANAVAASLGYSPRLTFLQGSIAGLAAAEEEEEEAGKGAATVDVVVALHACDTATDDALRLGMQMGAGVILCSPCCHKEVRREMKRSMKEEHGAVVGIEAQAAVLRHGILLERTAEIVTDSLRALCLESQGYRTSVMEFINDEATSKNLMLTATKRRPSSSSEQQARGKAVKQLRELMAHWGLRSQHLVRLLGLLESSDGGGGLSR